MDAEAVVFTKPNTVTFRSVNCPDPGPHDVVVRVAHTWISNGTEGSYLRGERLNGDTPRRDGDPVPFPLVPGYQQVGRVESVGKAVDGFTPGQTVFTVCGAVKGMFQPYGGHLNPSVASCEQVWSLPEGHDPLAFGALVLTQVGYNCGNRAPMTAGDHAVVLGDGMVGQWAAQTLAWRGARVILVGRRASRLGLAAELAGAVTLNESDGSWAEETAALTDRSLAVAVDTVGSAAMTETVIDLMRRGGHIVSAGFIAGNDRVSLQRLRDRELSLDSVAGLTPPRMDRTIELIVEGHLKTLPLITHRFSAVDAPRAWDAIHDRSEDALGVVLDWAAAK